MSWQATEAEVRRIAESVWSVAGSPSAQAGVRCDIVLKHKPDYWVLIEVSKRDDLNKLRDDIAKLSTVRLALMAKQVFSECYFVTSGDHTSLVETGNSLNVQVFDLSTFASKFIGARQYINERRTAPFGSAVDPDTGLRDERSYTPIAYVDQSARSYSEAQIARLLTQGTKIALVGEFGTGKSRCLMEVFKRLSDKSSAFVPIAINLRDNWGYRRLNHIIQNHMDGLGLGEFTDTLVRSLRRGNHILLLDGSDEIGSQSWSGDPARLTETRRKSLEGISVGPETS